MGKATLKKKQPLQDKRHPRFSAGFQPASKARLRRGLLLVLILAATAIGSWALLEFVILSNIPSSLVGKWVVEGGEQEGATFDFSRNGRMVGRVNVGGREGIIDARTRVEGDKLLTTTLNPLTGQDETHAQIIKVLTDRKLVLVDENKQVLELSRAE